MNRRVPVGFIPLVDAAPLILASALGFAEEEGLTLDLRRAASWSMLRDMLDFGQVNAAQMLSVVPVARALGLGGGNVPLEAPMVLSLNGQVFGLSRGLAGLVGHVPFGDALAVGRALTALTQPIRVGVPFLFSMHAELLLYWLGPSAQIVVRTVPPPRMAGALLADEIDAFCVGEPWGSDAVERAGAALALPGAAIWSQAPEKVLATRSGWCEAEPELAGRLMRAVWRAARWVAEPANFSVASEVLARPEHLDLSAELIERALTGQLILSRDGAETVVPQFLSFHEGAANFPWRSQAAWIGAQLARRFTLPDGGIDKARATFRSDLYRVHLAGVGAALPRGSDKVEGLLEQSEAIPAVHGSVTLARNRFFDGQIFDPGLR